MNIYEIKKGTQAFEKPFADFTAADVWAAEYFGSGYVVTELGPMPVKSDAQKLKERQEFGKQLINKYLIENDAIAKSWGRPFTVAEAAQQASKLQLIMALLPNGSLKQVVDILGTTAADNILTQDRIDSYISQLNAFIAAQ